MWCQQHSRPWLQCPLLWLQHWRRSSFPGRFFTVLLAYWLFSRSVSEPGFLVLILWPSLTLLGHVHRNTFRLVSTSLLKCQTRNLSLSLGLHSECALLPGLESAHFWKSIWSAVDARRCQSTPTFNLWLSQLLLENIVSKKKRALVKPKLENARTLWGIHFFNPEDEECEETVRKSIKIGNSFGSCRAPQDGDKT